MRSKYLTELSNKGKDELRKKLWQIQEKKCFICEQEINLDIQEIDIDHIEPQINGGADNESNFALTHSSCNRSKQAANLEVARILAKFELLKEQCETENRSPNLNDILKTNNDQKFEIGISVEDNMAKYTFPEIGNEIFSSIIYQDKLSKFKYFFAEIPIEYLYHDDEINPRAIGTKSLRNLIQEFFKKNPQLHVALGWIKPEDKKAKIFVFDGQHKAAAQVMLGVKKIPVRIFVDPNLSILLESNTNAGTKFRQVPFDKSVQRGLGSKAYSTYVKRYQEDFNLELDDFSFSEKKLLGHFKGESREMKRRITDAQRDGVFQSSENKLKEYIESGGKAKEKPLSYSTIEKTFFALFISGDPLETPINFKFDVEENPRQLEREQLINLMNIFAEEIYNDKFDLTLGTYRIENKLREGENIPEDHLIAYRLSKEEILQAWLRFIQQIIKLHFLTGAKTVFDENRLFQYKFPIEIWENITIFIRNFKKMPVWVNKSFSDSIFGGKQNWAFWQTIFETGKTPSGQEVLLNPIVLAEMMEDK
jgi:hypothetical protein